MDLPKAKALGSSLLLFTAVPWTLCLLLYSGGACGTAVLCSGLLRV